MSDNNERELLKQRRRALIKAAGAAPVVFTLPNGSALAASSTNACIDRGQALAAQDPHGYVEARSDGWVRVSVARVFKTNGNGGLIGEWFSYNGIDYTVTRTLSGITATQMSGAIPGGTQTGGSFYLLVGYQGTRLDGTAIYGVSITSQVGTPVAGASCWNSVNPTSPTAGTGNLI